MGYFERGRRASESRQPTFAHGGYGCSISYMQATVAADSQVGRFRFGNLALALVVVALVGGLGLWVSSVPSADGPLVDVHGDQVGAPVTPGVPFTYSMIPLQNVGSLPVTLLRATMGPHTSGLRLAGVGVSRHYAGYVVDPDGYPRIGKARPGQPAPTFFPLPGATIPGGPLTFPHANIASLIVGLEVQHPGSYVMKGMVVTYRVGAVIYTERIGPILAVCTPKPGKQACHLPRLQPW